MTLLSDHLKRELSDMYNAPGRAYHNLNHVAALLTLLEQHRDILADPEAVEAAIWFHDAVYDTRAKDNELKSAELAVGRLSGLVDSERLSCIRVLIEATATHVVPDFYVARAVSDAKIFMDMDLSILGVDMEQFDTYEADVRSEYGWADDEQWREGRAAVLASFLNKDRIFNSEIFHEQYEKTARQNLKRSLARLTATTLNTTTGTPKE